MRRYARPPWRVAMLTVARTAWHCVACFLRYRCTPAQGRSLSARAKIGVQEAVRMSPCDVKALQKCLEENDGNHLKCIKLVQEFQQACGQPKADAGKKTQARASS